MAILGNARSFFRRHSFVLEVQNLGRVGFSKCSELSVEISKIEHWEGGSVIPQKVPGRLTFSDITLERGATSDRGLYEWLSEVVQLTSGLGLTDHAYKRSLDLVQLDRDSAVVRRWSIYNAWPTKFVAGDWDNTADEVLIEAVSLTYDYFELSPLAG